MSTCQGKRCPLHSMCVLCQVDWYRVTYTSTCEGCLLLASVRWFPQKKMSCSQFPAFLLRLLCTFSPCLTLRLAEGGWAGDEKGRLSCMWRSSSLLFSLKGGGKDSPRPDPAQSSVLHLETLVSLHKLNCLCIFCSHFRFTIYGQNS